MKINKQFNDKLWEYADNDKEVYRELLLDILIIRFNIEGQSYNQDLVFHFDIKNMFEENRKTEEVVSTIQELFLTAPRGSRGNTAKCVTKLEWLKQTDNITDDEIVNATKEYIQECIELNRFAMLPQYFIHKAEDFSSKRKLEDSTLYEYIMRIRKKITNKNIDFYA